MKKRTLISAWVGLMSLSGCAALNIHDPIGSLFGAANDDGEERDANDPVTRAALAMRSSSASADAFQSDSISWRQSIPSYYYPPTPQQIVLGMSMSEVRDLWGRPSEVQAAGASSDGNQRWVYYSGLSSPWGLGEARIVYFERGQVAGWESER